MESYSHIPRSRYAPCGPPTVHKREKVRMSRTGNRQQFVNRRRWGRAVAAGVVFVATVVLAAGCMRVCGTGTTTAAKPSGDNADADGTGLAESPRPHSGWQPGVPPGAEAQ